MRETKKAFTDLFIAFPLFSEDGLAKRANTFYSEYRQWRIGG
jgi:hypothetical protein